MGEVGAGTTWNSAETKSGRGHPCPAMISANMSDRDTLPASTPDTLIRPSSVHEKPTVAQQARRSTVLPRLEWKGEVPVPRADPRLRFEELGSLGVGGMGEVVLAKDHDIERTVAIKRLKQQDDLGMVVRFVDEIRTVGALEHPNIVPVHDVGVDESGRYYFVMKHVRGESLEAIIARLKAGDAATHDRFPFHVRVQVFMSILNAMAYAHQQGFIHRDLKPANVMVGPFGEVTVMDWGLARHVHSKEAPHPPDHTHHSREGTVLETRAGALMGTPHYMSPEQARGEHDRIDLRCDIYALTVLFHEFLFLEHYLDDLEDLREVLTAVQERTPDLFSMKKHPSQPMVPAELAWFLQRGFEKDPAKRFGSVGEMVTSLQRVIDGRVEVHCERTFAKRMLNEGAHQVDKHPMALIAGAATVTAFAALGVFSVLHWLF